jgi:hypothetical protein
MDDHTISPRAVMKAYIVGTRTRDEALLRGLFHDDAVMTGWFEGVFQHGSPEPFYQDLRDNEVGPDYVGEIVSVQRSGKTALGTIREENLLGFAFTNYFHIVEVPEGGWRITSKMYRHD